MSRTGIERRALLGTATFGSLMTRLRPARAQRLSDVAREWGIFRERFLLPEGRVTDTGNGGVSHSEGQGVALLAAVHVDDRATFEHVRAWTRGTLSRPYDSLLSWRYRPGTAVPVDDPNNATDGDLLVALALFQASTRWGDLKYRHDALAMTRDLLRSVVMETPAGVVMLPGASGFVHPDRITLNPSYYIFPAIKRLATEVPNALWPRLWNDGLQLIRAWRFGRWELPPDWLALPHAPAEPQPAAGWPARFSFDAVRVPLYLAWAGLADDPIVGACVDFWKAHPEGAVPAWADLRGDAVAPYAQSSGMVAVRRYVTAIRERRVPNLPSVAAAQDYYAAALTLLTRIAVDDVNPGEV